MGQERFRRRLTQARETEQESTFGASRKLLQEGLDKMTAAVTAVIDAPCGQGLGRRHVAAKWCKMVGAEVAAFIALKNVLDGISSRRNIRIIARNIALNIRDELRFRRFEEKAPELFEYKLGNFHTSSYSHMARSLSQSMRYAEIDCSDIMPTKEVEIRIGIKLIDLVMETTGLAEMSHHDTVLPRGRFKTEVTLQATAETTKWLNDRNMMLELLHPVSMPMVMPPLRWSDSEEGGYRFKLRGKYQLVRKAGKQEALAPDVYESLNSIQNTAWRVNEKVRALIEQLLSQGGGVADLPPTADDELPAKPVDIDTNREALRRWKKMASRVKERNHSYRSKRLRVYRVLAETQEFAQDRAIYFPHSLDFRGRLYPICNSLSPQGPDVSRALLLFADAKPVDDEGARWMAIHGANCLGTTPDSKKVSTLTLEERVEWIHQNTPRLFQVADRPLEDLWWAEADKPFGFYAFCVEWVALIRATDRGEVYESGLPCAMDGTCNGLQHFAALFNDEIAARAVNVVPQDRPQDVYSVVAETVLRLVQQDKDPYALLWLGLHQKCGIISRKLCKRPTMTFGYGSKKFGFAAQIAEYLREGVAGMTFDQIKDHFAREEDGKRKEGLVAASRTMSRLIWTALGETVVSAFAGMDWMQKASRGITKQNQCVEWTVPVTGFRVRQTYSVMKRKRVRTILAGSAAFPSVWHATEKVDARKQANGIAPNFVHSMDAAVLMLTVAQAAAEGVDSFAMIHDSYGTVPADCATLASCCRRAFARLYTGQDVIQGLHSQLSSQWKKPEDCPAPPAKGSLDVSGVIASPYFFC